MGKKIRKIEEGRQKAPLIRGIVPICSGICMIIVVIIGLMLSSYEGILDIIGAIVMVIFFGGYGLLIIIKGLKNRWW